MDNQNKKISRQDFIKNLMELRKKAIKSGLKLMGADEILKEVARRRAS